MQRSLASELGSFVGERVRLQGWFHKLRTHGEVNFLILRDRTGLAQAVMSAAEIESLHSIPVESIISIEGDVVSAPPAPGGFELHHAKVEVLNAATDLPPIELNKKTLTASLPTLLDNAVISHRHPNQQAILRIASGVMQGFRQTLIREGFTEIQSPKLVGSATESGANVYSVEHFGQTAYLAQSPQFYKQIMVGVFERVFEVGPVFRAEKHATTRHINEYVSLDVEFGFIEDHFTVMQMVTTVITGILDYLVNCHAASLAQLQSNLPQIRLDKEVQTFPHIHFDDAQSLLQERYGMSDTINAPDLTPEHERLLGQWALEEYGSDYLFVTGYPMRKRPFYTHPDPSRPEFSNSFDLLFRGTELITGGQRLHRYQDYLDAIEAIGQRPEDYAGYLDAFKYGMPPHGGFAIGMERFVMQLLQLENIRQATLFPRDIHRLTP